MSKMKEPRLTVFSPSVIVTFLTDSDTWVDIIRKPYHTDLDFSNTEVKFRPIASWMFLEIQWKCFAIHCTKMNILLLYQPFQPSNIPLLRYLLNHLPGSKRLQIVPIILYLAPWSQAVDSRYEYCMVPVRRTRFPELPSFPLSLLFQ